LNIGSASGCNTTMTFGLYALVDATFYPSPTTYPDNIVYIDNSDTQHYGLIAVGPATTASIMLTANAANTVLFAPHLWGQAGTYGIRSTAPHVQLYFPQVDWGPGPQVAVSLGGGSAGLPQMVNGGHVLSPDATVVGVQIDSGTRPVIVSGFYCGNFSSTANCIKEVSPNGENLIYGNPSATQAPQYAQTLGQFPTGPGSTAAFSFLGLNLSITPQSSGILTAAATGAMSNNTVNDGGVFKVVVGTGTVPTNGQACSTGGGSTIYTQGTALNVMSATVGQIVPFAVSTRSLAQRGTSYWVDLCGQIKTGGAVSMWNVDLTVKEDGLRQ
jgi:hypothetical protein